MLVPNDLSNPFLKKAWRKPGSEHLVFIYGIPFLKKAWCKLRNEHLVFVYGPV